jgi:hypothetical protein
MLTGMTFTKKFDTAFNGGARILGTHYNTDLSVTIGMVSPSKLSLIDCVLQ